MAPEIGLKACTVVLHDDTISTEAVLCGIDVLPGGAFARLLSPTAQSLCVHAKVPSKNADEVSVHVIVAKLFGFENRTKAHVQLIENIGTATATHIELIVRDQHLSRADMWHINTQIDTSALYKGQILKYLESSTASVETIYMSGEPVDSAFATTVQTRLIFNSASARFTLLIQISKEMLDTWHNGSLMYERLIDGFLTELFQRWTRAKVRHQVSVVLFGRRYNSTVPDKIPIASREISTTQDLAAEDFYITETMNTASIEFHKLLLKLKRTFNTFRSSGCASLSSKGNMLEAINIATTDFADRQINPSLSSTGASIIAVTAGAGLFEADLDLLKSTTNLLMTSSIGVDMVSLGPRPLHPVPLFQYERKGTTEYALPHWADISYWKSDHDTPGSSWLLSDTIDEPMGVALPSLSQHSSHDVIRLSSDVHEGYDDATFCDATKKHTEATPAANRNELLPAVLSLNATADPNPAIAAVRDGGAGGVSMVGNDVSSQPAPLRKAHAPTTARVVREKHVTNTSPQSSRNISLGPRGLVPSAGVTSTTVSIEHATQGREGVTAASTKPAQPPGDLVQHANAQLRKGPSQLTVVLRDEVSISRPLDIENVQGKVVDQIDGRVSDPTSDTDATVKQQPNESWVKDENAIASAPLEEHAFRSFLGNDISSFEHSGVSLPWLTLLNPCNPQPENMSIGSEYRQWQNVFPRVVDTDVFKWDSICRPASLPLVAEAAASTTILEKHFNKTVRRLVLPKSMQQYSTLAHVALRQMTAMRLALGFQILPKPDASHSHLPPKPIDRVLLSSGTSYHDLCLLSGTELQITDYERAKDNGYPPDQCEGSNVEYHARLGSIISNKGHPLNIDLNRRPPAIDWPAIDDSVVNPTVRKARRGIFKSRFVLIPVTFRMANATHGRELSDEEKRLDGIQRLTQVWQRHRCLDTEEAIKPAKPMINSAVDRDPNPLAIEYQTRDPSEVVASLGSCIAGQLDGHDAQPLVENDLYSSSGFDAAKLVRHMQEPHPNGIELKDRRWFTRLHLKCFRGDEMTNWLLRTFRDLDTRENAVALGNELMNRDIFTHVRGKHEFRDGHYFYQIKSAYRTTDYPDTAGLFGKGTGRSVPLTPTTEARQYLMFQSQQGDKDPSSRRTPASTPILAPSDKKVGKEIMLSQVLQYNVDSAKKSGQLEVINLHYDRIHNPDNCYHIQLDWTITTPKLIREATTRWASLVENYGLKLVQLPLSEASKYSEQHPFHQPVRVKLALHSPSKTAVTPQHKTPVLSEDSFTYHKALLRKHEFVLDLESASSFPGHLNVKYSWGSPDYRLTQFVHKTGLVLAQISNDGTSDFILLPNPLVQHAVDFDRGAQTATTAESVIRAFVSVCRSEEALASVFEDVVRMKASSPSPFPRAALVGDGDVPPIELPPHLMHRAALRNVS